MYSADYPQLEAISDGALLAQTLQQYLGSEFTAAGYQVKQCQIRRVYFKPGNNSHCRLHFQATFGTAVQSEIGKQIFFGQLFPPEQVCRRFAAISDNFLVQPKFGSAVTLIPHWNMILWAYPNDPRLLGLPLLNNGDKLQEMMQVAPQRFGLPDGKRVASVNGRLTKYVPSLRCGYLYHVVIEGQSNKEETHTVYAKAYRPQIGPKTYTAWRQIWTQAVRQKLPLYLPQPYSYDERHHIFWQEALPGKPLAKLSISNGLSEITAQIGEQLALFHSLDLQLPPGLQLADQVADLKKSVKAISRAYPEVAERCRTLYEKLLGASLKLGPIPATPVHGSFKFSHIFLSNDRIAFIDVDGATCGDPAYDMGRFIAYLYKMQAAGKLSPPVVERAIANFCRSYQDTAVTHVPQTRINWYSTALLLSSEIYKVVKRNNPARLEALLMAVERMDTGV